MFGLLAVEPELAEATVVTWTSYISEESLMDKSFKYVYVWL
jgi:hypothetical protein